MEQLTAPGIIGKEKDKNIFTSMREWIKDAQEFKEEICVQIIDNKNKKSKEELIAELKKTEAEIMEYIHLQETVVKNLSVKVSQLDEEMENLLKDNEGEESEDEQEGSEA